MLNNFSGLIFNLSLLLPGVVFSRPLLANASYLLVPKLEVDVPCYMETADGRKLNLVTLFVWYAA